MPQQEFAARYSYDPKSDQLGSGGFGSVYKAYDNEEDCFVALKIAHVDMQHPELRLRNEVAKAERLKHKNVARYDACYTFTTFSGEMDIAVMRYYEHGSLDGFMRGGDLSMEERYDILTQILEGIAYLHSHGIIHRDLKPQNVLMVHHAGRYIPKITDFGISKQLEDGESSLVSNSVLGGTRSFASPEQLCERAIRKNTDLWSFGVIAYYMLVGELPFTTGTFSQSSDEGRSEQLRQILSGRLPEKINGVSEPWLSVIRGCLVVDGTQRLQHAEECLDILRNYKPAEEIVVVEVVADENTAVVVESDTTHIDNAAPAEQPKRDAPSGEQPTPIAQPKQAIPAQPKKKKSKWWLWLLLLLVVVGGIIIIGNADNKDAVTTVERSEAQEKRAHEEFDEGAVAENAEPLISGYEVCELKPEVVVDETSPETIEFEIPSDENEQPKTEVVVDETPTTGFHNTHEWVDLGLSVKWATCNVGANRPEDYGEYYAWGETSTKIIYLDDNSTAWNKRMEDIKGTNRDVAFVEWGGNWRMPTKEEFDELRKKCNWKWTGSGCEVTGPNGNSIYLPAAGYRYGEYFCDGLYGRYWSSTPYSEDTRYAYYLFFDSDYQRTVWCSRNIRHTVRPVLE